MSENTKTGLSCDTEHGWCTCGEWHEAPGKFKRRFGTKEKGITLWNSDRSHIPPEEVVDYFKKNYRPASVIEDLVDIACMLDVP